MKSFKNIDTYIANHPKDIQVLLKEMRATIQKAAPTATESIKYGMPTFELNGNLVHFAAMKSHLGFYPAPSGVSAFPKEVSAYSTSKGCIRFPYNKPIPYSLVKKIVQFRVKENKAK